MEIERWVTLAEFQVSGFRFQFGQRRGSGTLSTAQVREGGFLRRGMEAMEAGRAHT